MTRRWGLLGVARINRAVVPLLQESARHELHAVASRDLRRATAEAARWSIPRAYGYYEQLLADPEIDVVYIPLPNSLHVEWAIAALRGGKHVLCEKPLGLDLPSLDRLAAAAQATGCVVAEALMYRHHAQTFKVKELVDGAPSVVCAS